MEILYADRDLAVCIKPVGADSEHDIPQILSEQLGGTFYPIHRLDQNVGGVMVFARSGNAAAQLSRCVQEGSLKKEYVAMVHGCPPEQGVLEDLLWKDSRKNKVYVVRRERKGVKKAKLEYTRLSEGSESLVRVLLHTGRSHQIRVQFSIRGFPLVGDHKYGARDEEKAPRLFSCCIRFPWKGQQMRFEALPQWAEIPDYSAVSLETKDLVLKKGQQDDWKDMYENLWRHPESAKYMVWKVTASEAEARDRMARTVAFEKKEKYALLVYEKATGQAIGFAGMKEIEPGIFEESGIAIGPDYVGKGYGTQILRALLREAFIICGATEFRAAARTVNLPSLRMQEKVGMRFSHTEECIDPRDGTPYQLRRNVLFAKDYQT